MKAMRRRLREPTQFFSFAVFWIFTATLDASSDERHTTSSDRQPSEFIKISITDSWIEPPEKLVRRGSVKINVEGAGHVLLHEIKCADGSVGRVVFPRKDKDPRVNDEDDLEIKAPGLDLRPGAALNMSPDSNGPDYIDRGHLVFSKTIRAAVMQGGPLLCQFEFINRTNVETSFSTIRSIEDLIKF